MADPDDLLEPQGDYLETLEHLLGISDEPAGDEEEEGDDDDV